MGSSRVEHHALDSRVLGSGPTSFWPRQESVSLEHLQPLSFVQLTLAILPGEGEKGSPYSPSPPGPDKPGSITSTRGSRCQGVPSAVGALPAPASPAFSSLSMLPRRASRCWLWGSPSPPEAGAVGASASFPAAAGSSLAGLLGRCHLRSLQWPRPGLSLASEGQLERRANADSTASLPLASNFSLNFAIPRCCAGRAL